MLINKNILFIHGSPGDNSAFKKYLNDPILNEIFNIIAIDRPGFGRSKKYKSQPNMKSQADLISKYLIEDLKLTTINKNIIFFSHSYGAPLSVLVSNQIFYKQTLMNQTQLEINLLLVSGPFNPDFNMIRWYNHFANYIIIKNLIGKSLRSSNEEMMVLNKNLVNVKEILKKFRGKTYFIHGNKDRIVPIKHSKWAHELRENLNLESEFLEYPTNHFIIWNNFKKIRELILKLK